jgi:hypothetical protein
MNNMALLLATDDWNKMDAYQRHLSKHPQAAWRAKRHYTADYLHQIPFPVHLYFFHRNMIRYRARCTDIVAKSEWPLADVPPKFHSDENQYSLIILIDSLAKIPDQHISSFSRWEDPMQHFERGRLGLLGVIDVTWTIHPERKHV